MRRRVRLQPLPGGGGPPPGVRPGPGLPAPGPGQPGPGGPPRPRARGSVSGRRAHCWARREAQALGGGSAGPPQWKRAMATLVARL
ncbi:hypothetical protein FFZ77_07090 [Streptomyces katsurahamanus]|uniref:Uncharacterized protein n=1 Tax=Streptomyces katsurahamanus TaxID=2577098 RepID=A0ABW9NQ61_9ACTN|nr:hypothetical protein [Streptomyces katsurahamanus]